MIKFLLDRIRTHPGPGKRIRSETTAEPQEYKNVAVVFVCQSGEWELKALLLAASLRRWCGDAIELIAAVPNPPEIWGVLSDATEQQLKELGVRQQPIANHWGTEFSHANKISCLRIQTSRQVLVFLDSDILCLGRPNFDDPGDNKIMMKLADAVAFENDVEGWHRIYEACGLPAPSARYPMTATAEYSFPFFNSGVMIVASSFAPRLAREWERMSGAIRSDENLPKRRLWSDQLGLAVALHKLEIKPRIMDLTQNHPTHLMPLTSSADVRLSHYHWPAVVHEEPRLVSEMQQYVTRFPAIRQVVESNPEWLKVLESEKNMERSECKTLLITGISRSGTSYLCQLVDSLSNAVALNETPELIAGLQGLGPAWALPVYLRRVRKQIAAGEPVENKVWDGTVIGDTALRDELSTYLPKTDDENFVLAAKNTFAFLSSLPRIRRVLPDARIVVCVRNPFDTIASWKTSFPHLLNAETSIRPVGNADDPWLSSVRSAELRLIAETGHLPSRRAMLWRYLAERVLEDRGNHVLVRYEELIVDPTVQLRRMLGNWDGGKPTLPMKVGRFRSKLEMLDAEDIAAISAICADVASELGVWGRG